MQPFTLPWFIANFLLIWLAYGIIRAAWKLVGVVRLSRTVGLRIGRFVRGRGGIGLVIGIAALIVTIVALFQPWYSVTAIPQGQSSAVVQLISLSGIKGFNASLLSNQTGSAALSITNIVSVNAPFAMMFAVGIPLLIIDVIGVTRGSRLGRKFVDGGIILLIALALIYVWFSLLPTDVPLTSSLLGGASVSPQGSQLLSTISSNAVGGSASGVPAAAGTATVNWGFGLGAYLLILAAVLRFIAGGVMSLVPSLAPPAPTPIPHVGSTTSEPTRRLAAIMFTDIVGYTAMTQANEARAMQLLEKHRKLIRPIFPKHSGREIKTIGDAFLVEFHSALEATECAVEMQKTLHDYVEPTEDKVKLKIGIHVGDVIHKDGDVYGDAVNIASRIEPLAVGGGICISEQVYDQIRNKIPYKLVKLEPKELKNVAFHIDTYLVQLPWETPPPPPPPAPGQPTK